MSSLVVTVIRVFIFFEMRRQGDDRQFSRDHRDDSCYSGSSRGDRRPNGSNSDSEESKTISMVIVAIVAQMPVRCLKIELSPLIVREPMRVMGE